MPNLYLQFIAEYRKKNPSLSQKDAIKEIKAKNLYKKQEKKFKPESKGQLNFIQFRKELSKMYTNLKPIQLSKFIKSSGIWNKYKETGKMEKVKGGNMLEGHEVKNTTGLGAGLKGGDYNTTYEGQNWNKPKVENYPNEKSTMYNPEFSKDEFKKRIRQRIFMRIIKRYCFTKRINGRW